jgi:hypothetical protein
MIQYKQDWNRYKKQVIYSLNHRVMLPNWENCAPNGPSRAALGGLMRAPRAGTGARCLPYGLGRAGCGR